MNAPVPPVNEPETLKQQNQYQASYNQSFPSQPHQVEQTELQQDQLQTGKKGGVTFYGFVVVRAYPLCRVCRRRPVPFPPPPPRTHRVSF